MPQLSIWNIPQHRQIMAALVNPVPVGYIKAAATTILILNLFSSANQWLWSWLTESSVKFLYTVHRPVSVYDHFLSAFSSICSWTSDCANQLNHSLPNVMMTWWKLPLPRSCQFNPGFPLCICLTVGTCLMQSPDCALHYLSLRQFRLHAMVVCQRWWLRLLLVST